MRKPFLKRKPGHLSTLTGSPCSRGKTEVNPPVLLPKPPAQILLLRPIHVFLDLAKCRHRIRTERRGWMT